MAFLQAAEAVEMTVRFEEGLLHHVGGVQLAPQLPADLDPGQQVQVGAVVLQQHAEYGLVACPGARQQVVHVGLLGTSPWEG